MPTVNYKSLADRLYGRPHPKAARVLVDWEKYGRKFFGGIDGELGGYEHDLGVLIRDQQGECFYCHRLMGAIQPKQNRQVPDSPTIDHLIPASCAGKGDNYNCVAACAECNWALGEFLHKSGETDASLFLDRLQCVI